jgi:NTP pyrophosphatase (non-canonical NTP hydrolase)
MNLNEYQAQAMSVRLESANDLYAKFGIVGELGELFSFLAKAIRDGRTPEYEQLIKKELGDIQWFIAAIAADHGWTLEDIAQSNLNKLFSRRDRGTLQGSGDNR